MGKSNEVQFIPPTAWLLAYAATASACFHWHNRQPSAHLRMMGWGMCLDVLVMLPAVFSAWAGHDELARFADSIMPEENPELWDYYGGPRDSGVRLLEFCDRLYWIGYAVFALGFWRFAKELAAKAAYPPVDQA